MFSGIIRYVGTVDHIVKKNEGATLTVSGGDDFKGFELGESIAVNGVCLTVRDSSRETFTVDLSAETLNRTCFKSIENQTRVNLERSITPSDKISGHFVSGHVDCVGHITFIDHKSGEIVFCFKYPVEYIPYIIEKGSVSIDGISLTVFSCVGNSFSVSIIPFTFSHTNLAFRKVGDAVNIEYDMIGKYIYKACETILLSSDKDNKASLEMLRKQGILK
jgi:riboflavin synthase